jgi:hypothetical protein
VLTRDVESYYTYLTTRLAAIEAIDAVESAPCIREIKRVRTTERAGWISASARSSPAWSCAEPADGVHRCRRAYTIVWPDRAG